MNESAVAARKRTLRAEMRRRLDAQHAEARRAAGGAAAERALALEPVESARGVLVFLSFGGEIDTAPLVERLLGGGKRLFVPRLERAGAPLEICRFPCALARSSFGIDQPAPTVAALGEEQIPSEVDAAVVPGLAFDRACRRLGYGAGSFDRFLSGRRLFTVGFAFDLQVVERVPVEPHDVALDRVVTESRTLPE